MALALIASHNQGTQVVYLTPQNFTAAFVRQPVYISENIYGTLYLKLQKIGTIVFLF